MPAVSGQSQAEIGKTYQETATGKHWHTVLYDAVDIG
jgi:hypothetical protein